MSKNTTVTVVLTTYNGEQFVGEQLSSILEQTMLPDELIILDDCSSDGTVDIVSHMIQGITDIKCRLIVNEKNKGWRRNFIDGFHMASGDIIFCADQDDIWEQNKLERMTKTIADNPQINVLACNLTPLYEDGATKLADFYIENYGDGHIAPVRLEDHGFTVLRPGCTICFRREILNQVDAVWEEKLAHDEVLWAIGLATDSLYILNEPLIQFRRHGKNNSPSNAKHIAPRLERAECEHIKAINILRSLGTGLDKQKENYLSRNIDLNNARIKAFQTGKIAGILGISKRIRLYNGIRPYIADLVCILRG